MQTKASPFANSTYLRLFLAQATSLAGTGITTIALALLAWQLAQEQAGQVLGTALALKMVAYVCLSPLVGSFVHALPRRTWLVGLDVARALLVLGLPFLTQVWQIYVLLFFINACSAGFTPVFQAIIPTLFKDDEQYHKALSYSRLAYNLEQLLSPTLAALLLTLMSFKTLFVLDALTFLVSAILVLTCALPVVAKSQRPDNFLYNVQFGLAAYLKTPRLRALLAMYIAVACASAMVIVNTVVYVQHLLGGGESQTALALAISGAGSMLAALLLPRWLKEGSPRPVLLGGTALLVVGLFSASLAPGWIGFAAIWFVLGIGLSVVQTPSGALLRMSCHPGDLPALFSANFSLSHLCWLGAYLLAGHLGSTLGLATTFALMGLVSLLALAAAWKIYPDPDPLELEHSHQALTHSHYHDHDAHHDHQHEGDERHLRSFGQEPHQHQHRHRPIRHKHRFVIDLHHDKWPRPR